MCLRVILFGSTLVVLSGWLQAACFQLQTVRCPTGSFGPPCSQQACNVTYVGGSNPGDPPIATYQCPSNAGESWGTGQSFYVGVPHFPNGSSGSDSITTAQTFVYCVAYERCDTSKPCIGGKCQSIPGPGTGSSKQYDVALNGNICP